MRSLIAFVLLATAAVAADPLVRVRAEPEGPVAPGQPVRVVFDLLVPTWFTKGPRWPQLEVANAIVILPGSRAVSLSESIDGETWSGQSREYFVCPLNPGRIEVPPFELTVQFAQSEPVTVTTPSLTFEAAIPEEALGKRFRVTSPSFRIEESLDPVPEGLKVGDAVTRTVTMTGEETFGLFLPPLRFGELDGASVYPGQPRMEDKGGERGDPRLATRVDSVTYLFERGGSFRLPGLELPWWNPATRTLETARLPEHEFEVTAPPAPPETGERDRSWLWLLFGLAVVLTLIPRWRRAYAASEAACFRRFERACRRGDAKETWRTLHLWLDRTGVPTPEAAAALDNHLFGSGGDWSPDDLLRALTTTRRGLGEERAREPDLAPLNP